MDDRLIERLFAELDAVTSRVDELAKVVFTNGSALGILTKIVVGGVLSLIAAVIALWIKM
jgi:hypothetical protein